MCVQVYYAKFPPQIDRRQILLLHPVLGRCVPKPLTKLTLKHTHALNLARVGSDGKGGAHNPQGARSQGRENPRHIPLRHTSWRAHAAQRIPQNHNPHFRGPQMLTLTFWRHLFWLRLTTPLLRVCIYCGSRVFEFKSTNETLSLSTDPMCKHELGILNWAWFWQYKKCYFL